MKPQLDQILNASRSVGEMEVSEHAAFAPGLAEIVGNVALTPSLVASTLAM